MRERVLTKDAFLLLVLANIITIRPVTVIWRSKERRGNLEGNYGETQVINDCGVRYGVLY